MFNESAMAQPLSDTEVNIITSNNRKRLDTSAMINQCVVYVIKNYAI